MTTSLTNVIVRGFDTNNPGDPVAVVSLNGMSFQAGEEALWSFVDSVVDLVSAAQNVDSVVTTKYETVSTVI